MTRPEAFALYKLVNSESWTAFVEFKSEELQKQRVYMDTATGDRALRIQGNIESLKSDLALRDKVMAELNKET